MYRKPLAISKRVMATFIKKSELLCHLLISTFSFDLASFSILSAKFSEYLLISGFICRAIKTLHFVTTLKYYLRFMNDIKQNHITINYFVTSYAFKLPSAERWRDDCANSFPMISMIKKQALVYWRLCHLVILRKNLRICL